MSQNTRTWAEAVGLTQARAGASFAAGTELDNIGFLLNSAARTIYDESRWWERFLVVEERTVVDGYIPYAEDGKDTIGEYIGHWDGELWTCADSQRGQAYPDHNGIKIANCNHGDTVWVAYKKEFTDTYGDGENGTVSDIPAEWIEFMSYDAARAYAASQGNQDGYNPVAIRDVDRALERALMKVSRQGINETIALYFRTNYGYDVSVK